MVKERFWRYARRHSAAIALDFLSATLAFYLALMVRFAGRTPMVYFRPSRPYVLVVAGLYVLCNIVYRLYGRLWRYASTDELISIVESVATSTLLVTGIELIWPGERPIPLGAVLLGGFFCMAAFSASRYRVRLLEGLLLRWRSRTGGHRAEPRERVLVVGAGEAGQLLARRLRGIDRETKYDVIGFVDDDPAKHDMLVHGARVLGGRDLIPRIVAQHGVDLIVIGIHRVSMDSLRPILRICEKTEARIKMLPNVFESLEGSTDSTLLRDVTIEELVGRETVSISDSDCRRLLSDKVVLVTGAAGTIGSELCRQVVRFGPRQLAMVDNNETGLHELSLELQDAAWTGDAAPVHTGLSYIVGDVTDRRRMERIIGEHHPQLMLHAAAHKHVSLMESFPEEAIRVNVGGTLCVAELAANYEVERFVFVSTDKAVDPVCVMGATKRVGELIMSAFNSKTSMTATSVRFGNVLGSRGSVVPTFRKQIERGGPLTVTSAEATRFFMSVDEAASLIVQAASMATGGEVFILDMGEQIGILDLARKMIRLRGLRVGRDIPIVFTGLRRGEKLHEALVGHAERPTPTFHPHISAVRPAYVPDSDSLSAQLDDLLSLLRRGGPRQELTDRLFAISGEGSGSPVDDKAASSTSLRA